MNIGQQYNPFKLFHGCFVPNWLLCRQEISQGAKLCFARLAQYAGESGNCYPAIETMAKELGVQERMIRRYIDELEEFSLIKKHKRGQGKTNYYTFVWHEWSKSIVIECNQERTDMSTQERNSMSGQERTDMSDKENHIRESKEKNHKTIVYSQMFIEVWDNIFPHPIDRGSKTQSYKNWCNLLAEGFTELQLKVCAENWVKKRTIGKLNYNYNCSNFYGEKRYFEGNLLIDESKIVQQVKQARSYNQNEDTSWMDRAI